MKQIPWRLLKKKINGQLSEEEQVVVDEWLQRSDENPFIVEELADKMKRGIPYPGDFEPDETMAWHDTHSRLQGKSVFTYTRKQLYRFAAVVTIPLLLTGFISGYLLSHDFKSVFNADKLTVIYSAGGQKTLITLPDHSKVWLNAKTTLKYSSNFNQKNRELFLDGEAFFDVAKMKIPFIVHTNTLNLKVLGTAFNVKCYSDDKTVEATLVRGSLKIENLSSVNGVNEEILLKPNQKIVFQKAANGMVPSISDLKDSNGNVTEITIAKKPVLPVKVVGFSNNYDTKISTSWKDGLFIFKSEKLGDLAAKVARTYDVSIVFDSEEIKNYQFTGTLRELSLEQLMNALKMTSPITFTIKEKTVFIKENKEVKGKYKTITN